MEGEITGRKAVMAARSGRPSSTVIFGNGSENRYKAELQACESVHEVVSAVLFWLSPLAHADPEGADGGRQIRG